MISLGRVYLKSCNYEIGYDLLSQDIATNKSLVRMYGVLHVTSGWVSWSSGTATVHTADAILGTYYTSGDYVVVQQDFTFSHNSQGNFSQYIGGSLNTTYTSGSTGGVMTLPTIPRQANITNAPDFTDEENPKITYSNPAGNSVTSLEACISLTGATDDIAYRPVSKTETEYTFNLTEEERNVLRNATPNSNTLNVNFYLKTILGGNTYFSIVSKKMTIVNGNPIFNDFEFEDINPLTLALTGNSKYNVNKYSNIKATISNTNKAIAKKGSSMSKYRFVCGTNEPKDITYSSSESVSETINGATSGTYNIYAIDSRNNSTLVTKLATREINYEEIYINSAETYIARNNNQVGTNAILTLKGTFWNDTFGLITNTIKSVTYQLKKSDSSTWITGTTTITPTVSGNNFTFEGQIASDNQDTTWDLDSSYNIRITISDELSTKTVELILNSAIPTMSFDKEGVGIMGAYDRTLGGKLQVGGKVIKPFESYIIYENSSGNNGTIIFDENPYNYSYIEIYGYEGVFDTSFYTKYDMSLNKTISLYKLSTNAYQNRLQVTNYGIRLNSNNNYEMFPINSYMNVIFGTTINNQTNNQEFYITKIVAYK